MYIHSTVPYMATCSVEYKGMDVTYILDRVGYENICDINNRNHDYRIYN